MSASSRSERRGRAPRAVLRRVALLASMVALSACRDRAPHDGALLAEPDEAVLADAMVTSGASARRVADFALTLDNVERWFEADAALDALAEDDPGVARRLADAPGERRGDDPIARAAAHLSDVPGAREALEEAGTTPYEYVLTGLALHQALLATGPGSTPTLRRLATRNARFVERNADVLARYAERRPRYLATYEPDPYDLATDTVVWMDTAAAAGDVTLDSAYAVDTLAAPDTLPLAPIPMPVDTALPIPEPPVPPVIVPAPPPASPAPVPPPAGPSPSRTTASPPPGIPPPAPR